MMRRTKAGRRGGNAMPERRRTIVVWGAPQSGKSGLIGALRSEATKSVGDRWALDLDDASPEVVSYAESSSLALRLRGVKDTPIRRPERAFSIPVRRHDGRRITGSIDLTILDPRGDLADEPTSPTARQVLAAARTADGILWLIEAPSGEAKAIRQLSLLRQVVAILNAAATTGFSVPVVVALTKIDRLPAADLRRLSDGPEASLRSMLGDAAFGWLLAAFPRLHCVAISTAGSVRNAVRPIGLTNAIDWFAEEWRREEHERDAARVRARRSAHVARIRRRAPIAAMIAAAAAIVAFAGVAAARLLQQRGETWASSAGSVALHNDSASIPTPSTHRDSADATPSLSFASAAARVDNGNAVGALEMLAQLRIPDSSSQRFAADSLIAVAALRGMESVLSAKTPAIDALRLIVSSTTAAIGRAHPGTPVLAPLSLARAGACIGGRLNCPADQVREDLAWAVILGTPEQQDQARRLRAALVGDSLTAQ